MRVRLKGRLIPVDGTPPGGKEAVSGFWFVVGGRPIVTEQSRMFEPECGCLILVGMYTDDQEPWVGFDPCADHEDVMRSTASRYGESLVDPVLSERYGDRDALAVAVEMWTEEAAKSPS
jgi:hypothetical protein